MHFPLSLYLFPFQWKSYFFPHFGFGLKTRSQFRSACKNQREISSDKVGRLLWSLGGKYAGKGGEMVYGEGEMQYRVRIEFTVSLDTTLGPITKFLKNVQKMREKYRKNYFSYILLFDSKTRSQFKSACKKSETNLWLQSQKASLALRREKMRE